MTNTEITIYRILLPIFTRLPRVFRMAAAASGPREMRRATGMESNILRQRRDYWINMIEEESEDMGDDAKAYIRLGFFGGVNATASVVKESYAAGDTELRVLSSVGAELGAMHDECIQEGLRLQSES